MCLRSTIGSLRTLSGQKDSSHESVFHGKKQMLQALEASRTKLDEYYSQTNGVSGHIYAISKMLAPVNKFKSFLTDDWDTQWRDTYRTAFEQALVPYQAQIVSQSEDIQIATQPSSRLEEMLDRSGILVRCS
jgi:hypothetical protein